MVESTLNTDYFIEALLRLSNGLIASAGRRPFDISLWDVSMGRIVNTLSGHTNVIWWLK